MKKSAYLFWKYFLILIIPCLVFLTENCNENPDKKYLVTQDTIQIFHPLDRINSQIDFVRRLFEFYPDKKQYWNDLLDETNGFVNDFVSHLYLLKLSEAVKRAEDELLKIGLYEDYNIKDISQTGPEILVEFQKKANYLNERIRWSGQGRTYLIRAKSIVYESIAPGDDKALQDLLKKVEKTLQPISAAAKTFTVHCIGHAHIDMNWLWPWEETVNVTNETFITVLNLMDEFPEFHFTQSQASVYEIIRKNNPVLFKIIQKRVQEGRWEIAASQWVEGDKNMAAGESLARHLLYTRKYMEEHFGLKPEDVSIDWEPDAFGHALSLPAILSRGGVRYYYCSRAGVGIERPTLFWWESPDGSRILVNLEKESWYNETVDVQRVIGLLNFFKETNLRDYMAVYGVGDHGGGPTREDILKCIEMDSWPVYPNFKMTTTKKYFEIIDQEQKLENIPVLKTELNTEFTGCYTSQSQIKKFNRYGEIRLNEAETAGILGTFMIGNDYPGERLKEACTKLLFNQFHDILPGSNVPLSVDYQSGRSQEIFEITSMISSNTYRSIASAIKTADVFDETITGRRPDAWAYGAGAGRNAELGNLSSAGYTRNKGNCMVVFNPSSWKRNELIRATLWDYLPKSSTESMENLNFIVESATGVALPVQIVADESSDWAHTFIDIMFPAEISALGYNTYLLTEGPNQGIDQSVECAGSPESGFSLQNQYLKVDIDPLTGNISHLLDKISNVNFASSDNHLSALEYLIEDGGDAWTIGTLSKRIYPLNLMSVKKDMEGPYIASVKSTYSINQSEIALTYLLDYNKPYIEIDVEMDWKEVGSEETGTPMLRIMFPFPFENAEATYEIPYGSVTRSQNNGEEVPALRWANVNGTHSDNKKNVGCLLINDCNYGHSLDNNI